MSLPLPCYPAMTLLAGFQQKFLDQFCNFQPADEDPPPLAFQHDLPDTLMRALTELYSGCRALLGDVFFDDLCSHYLRCYPPAIQRLDCFGDHMAQFMSSFAPARHTAQLPALARLEWAVFQACQARPGSAFDREGFAAARWQRPESVNLQLAPGLGLLQAEYAVDLLWQHHRQNLGAAGLKFLDHGAVRLVVLVHEGKLQVERLNEGGWHSLLQLLRNPRLSSFEQALAEHSAELLEWAVQRGWVAGFSVAVSMPELAGVVGKQQVG